MTVLPRYPIYVISKGRWESGLTAKFLLRDGVPFHLVVEPQEADAYASAFGEERVLVLPFSNLGQGSIPARNWLWEHARERGAERHWCLDDNIRGIARNYDGRRIRCVSGPALAAVEDFTDRYENIAVAGLRHSNFGLPYHQ
jgi:TET-Associated Glycosyltransferase